MRLLKLVIVDDEPILLQGLIKTYNWEEMGFEVVGSARNGEKAIEVIREKHPHVVLTDIRMKQISGLMVMEEIEKENPGLKGVLIKQYNSPDYKNVNLGELIDIFTNVKIGSKESQDKDLLGRIYEYLLGQFASNELQKGGEFYTPACLVRTMVEMIEPQHGSYTLP